MLQLEETEQQLYFGDMIHRKSKQLKKIAKLMYFMQQIIMVVHQLLGMGQHLVVRVEYMFMTRMQNHTQLVRGMDNMLICIDVSFILMTMS